MIDSWWRVPVVLAVLAVSVALGSPVTRLVLRTASRRSRDEDARSARSASTAERPAPDRPASGRLERDASAPDRPGASSTEALRGGTWIGYLERLAITGAVLAGYPAAIAVVVAVKGLGRYPELHDRPLAAERFVIGTLASFVWAALCGLGALALVRL